MNYFQVLFILENNSVSILRMLFKDPDIAYQSATEAAGILGPAWSLLFHWMQGFIQAHQSWQIPSFVLLEAAMFSSLKPAVMKSYVMYRAWNKKDIPNRKNNSKSRAFATSDTEVLISTYLCFLMAELKQ